MVLSAFPMFLATALIFYPIFEAGSILNGLWLGFFMAMFYIFFTAYANPFLALVSELGQNQSVRINISTFIALFGLIGVAIVTVMFEETAFSFMGSGMDMRNAYSLTAVIFAGIACVFGYISVLGFKESKHCMPSEPAGLGVIDSLKRSYSVKHFRIFLTAELSVMFCVNILTMGLAYYASVLFQQPMMYVAGIALGGAAVSFYFVNKLSKVYGKKIIIIIGVIILSVGTLLFFILSFNLTGISVYLGYLILLCLGFPLAALSTLMYSTTADIAREDALRTGIRREAMFYGARAVPLKLVIALSGIVFGVLLSVGRDIANPLGIQLSLIVVSVVSVLSLFFFTRYPEKDVLESLEHYERQLDNPEGFAAEIEQKPLNA